MKFQYGYPSHRQAFVPQAIKVDVFRVPERALPFLVAEHHAASRPTHKASDAR